MTMDGYDLELGVIQEQMIPKITSTLDTGVLVRMKFCLP